MILDIIMIMEIIRHINERDDEFLSIFNIPAYGLLYLKFLDSRMMVMKLS